MAKDILVIRVKGASKAECDQVMAAFRDMEAFRNEYHLMVTAASKEQMSFEIVENPNSVFTTGESPADRGNSNITGRQ